MAPKCSLDAVTHTQTHTHKPDTPVKQLRPSSLLIATILTDLYRFVT